MPWIAAEGEVKGLRTLLTSVRNEMVLPVSVAAHTTGGQEDMPSLQEILLRREAVIRERDAEVVCNRSFEHRDILMDR